MNNNGKPHDAAAEAELKGVPEEFLEGNDFPEGKDFDEGVDHDAVAMGAEIAGLRAELGAAKQEVLYAQAETQNVRRRLEREKDEARAYAATGFARDILSVADNLTRAVQAIPESLRADDSMKGLVIGIEATQRELEKVFASHGITRIAAVGLPLDPNQHQAMLEVPTADQEPGTVVSEMQAGWMIKDRLLRAAMVAVAKSPD
ncbi:nucleotide exchange factor GrpE [Erythrobacter sp. R86502]|uniref:nucleotide exchange factor GrpE n=1 Tax=Erythrobacter sp. R86502 TaxID=3093846 RepID=UPI0036D2C723